MKNNNKFRLDVWGAITLGTIALYALFLLYPMAYLIRQSVLTPTPAVSRWLISRSSFKSYYFDTLINSFKVSITATVLSIAIGTPLAYLFTIFKIKGKSVLNILIVVASMSAPSSVPTHGSCCWAAAVSSPPSSKTSASPSRTSTASAASCWS